MGLNRLFNRPLDHKRNDLSAIDFDALDLDTKTLTTLRTTLPKAGAGTDQGTSEKPVTGAFITAESLTSFAGATGAISVIWSTVSLLAPGASAYSTWIGFAISVLVGLVIYWINISDPAAPLSGRQKGIGLIIAILNTLVLFTASFGVTTALGK